VRDEKPSNMLKLEKTLPHNFVSFQVFQNPFSPACLSQRDAHFILPLHTKNVDGLAMRDENPSADQWHLPS
jgi:hypothetical protein